MSLGSREVTGGTPGLLLMGGARCIQQNSKIVVLANNTNLPKQIVPSTIIVINESEGQVMSRSPILTNLIR